MMNQTRIILMGNAGVGKTTMAKAIMKNRELARLSLDEIAWEKNIKRKPHEQSVAELMKFIQSNSEWIIEGCYGDLIREALPHCSELRFLNPGIETSIKHCRQRPWEPEKFTTTEEQNQNLQNLLDWVAQYETRNDEYGLSSHREIFNRFQGRKREYCSVSEYNFKDRPEERASPTFDRELMMQAREKTQEALNRILNSLQVGDTEEDAKSKAVQIMDEMGFEKQWHKINIRFGINTTKSFRENSEPNVRLKENDIAVVDIGPVWNSYEGDAGDTRVFGSNERLVKLARDAREIFEFGSKVWREKHLSGDQLFSVCSDEARRRGWEMTGRHMSGHRLSDFPHAAYYKGRLADIHFPLTAYAWVLEVALFDPQTNRASFYEDLLFDS